MDAFFGHEVCLPSEQLSGEIVWVADEGVHRTRMSPSGHKRPPTQAHAGAGRTSDAHAFLNQLLSNFPQSALRAEARYAKGSPSVD